jgi:hypothetical protein
MTDPRLLKDAFPIVDGDVLRCDWENSQRFYLVRLYPAPPFKGRPQTEIQVQLEGDPRTLKRTVTDADACAIWDETSDLIGAIAIEMDSTWDAEASAELQDRYASESRFYYR